MLNLSNVNHNKLFYYQLYWFIWIFLYNITYLQTKLKMIYLCADWGDKTYNMLYSYCFYFDSIFQKMGISVFVVCVCLS